MRAGEENIYVRQLLTALGLFLVLAVLTIGGPASAQAEPATPVEEAAAAVNTPSEITLSDMLEQGGYILWIIVGLSFLAAIMALYCFMTVTVGREAPERLIKRARSQVEAGDIREAWQMCDERDEILARVYGAGLRLHGHDRFVIQEAMESEGERGAAALWQKISYLNNIGHIAPLLGLLGTVTGMIRAFGAIALDDSQVKGLTMAYSVSQAMITTAAGLMLAIPAMVVYFYLRGRVIKIVAVVEEQASEMVELLTRKQRR
jgi:biopolymer transport protein ExbB